MPVVLLASFPNSRFKVRSPTTEANTNQMAVGKQGDPLTLAVPANLDRTYALLTNLDAVISLNYIYALTAPGVNPTVVPTFGVTDQLLYDSVGNIVYQKQDNGTNTNWIVVLPQNVCEVVLPYQSAQLESLGDIYALAQSAVSGISIALDIGRG